MKFPKVGDLRIKCMIDYDGDYVASVQVYRGFWKGWTNQRSFYAIQGRTPDTAVAHAKEYLAQRQTPLLLGVIA